MRAQPDYKDQLAHVHVTPAKGGKLVPLAEVADVYGVILGADIERALKMKRVTHLYAHQAEALGCANDVIVATPTSSGKSLDSTSRLPSPGGGNFKNLGESQHSLLSSTEAKMHPLLTVHL